MGGAAVYIKEDFGLDDWQIELFLASLSLMAIPGAYLAGWVSDTFGRRRTLTVASCFFFVGMIFMTVAPSFPLLLMGRLLTGFGVGTGLSIDPMYVWVALVLFVPPARSALTNISSSNAGTSQRSPPNRAAVN